MAAVRLESKSGVVDVGGADVVLMGVINRSPESNNKDVFAESPERAVAMAAEYERHGVRIIDIGGQSTNYENPDIGVVEELRRLIPTVDALRTAGFVVSVDTWKPEVAAAVLDAGAALINDTGGLKDPKMVEVLAQTGAPAVLMYLEAGVPNDAEAYDTADGKSARIRDAIGARLAALATEGVKRLVVDPGIAISYRTDYEAYTRVQFEVAANLDRLRELDAPVLYAVPRKDGRHRNVALAALAMQSGADMLRIHDIAEIADIARLMGRLSAAAGAA
ncbi:MAG: dihydropteroate synthase [Acidimicrobiia bacterium]|nr:dihydropteroate synthase [Acidimicrobiia bacterium]